MLIPVIITIIIIIILIICIFWYTNKQHGAFRTSIKKYVKDDLLDNRIKIIIDVISDEINDIIVQEYNKVVANTYSIDLETRIDYPDVLEEGELRPAIDEISSKLIKKGIWHTYASDYLLNIIKAKYKKRVNLLLSDRPALVKIDILNIHNILTDYARVLSPFFDEDWMKSSTIYNIIKLTLLSLIEYLTICHCTNQTSYTNPVKILSWRSTYNFVLKVGTKGSKCKILRIRYPFIRKYDDINNFITRDYSNLANAANPDDANELILYQTCKQIYNNPKLLEYLPRIYMSSFDYEFMNTFNHCIWYLEDEYEPIIINRFRNPNMVYKYAQTLYNILRYLHEMGLYYGDWKLENLMLDRNDKFILIDFDISANTDTIVSSYGVLDHYIGRLYPNELAVRDIAIAFFDVFNVCRCYVNRLNIKNYENLLYITREGVRGRIHYNTFDQYCNNMPGLIDTYIFDFKKCKLIMSCIELFSIFEEMRVFKERIDAYVPTNHITDKSDINAIAYNLDPTIDHGSLYDESILKEKVVYGNLKSKPDYKDQKIIYRDVATNPMKDENKSIIYRRKSPEVTSIVPDIMVDVSF